MLYQFLRVINKVKGLLGFSFAESSRIKVEVWKSSVFSIFPLNSSRLHLVS